MHDRWLSLLEWPAMALTLVAAYLVASQSSRRRNVGFWTYLGSNVVWGLWGWHDTAYAVVVLQVFLAGLNVRGILKNDPRSAPGPASA